MKPSILDRIQDPKRERDRQQMKVKEFRGTQTLRLQTVHLTCRLLAQLLDSGLVTSGELSIIRRNLTALAKTGELAPVIPPRLITGPEAAEMLSVSYSQFRALEKEGAFPFRRRMIGGKTVRYLNKDILDYAQTGSLAEDDTKEECNE